jgi:hypothetical protein
MKIRPMGADLFNADRRTDMAKPIVAFRYLANAPENGGLFGPELVTEWLKHALT